MKFEIRCIRCLRVLRGEVNGDVFNCWLAGCGALNSLSHDNPDIAMKIGSRIKHMKAAKGAKSKK